jgi:hypothetical protein
LEAAVDGLEVWGRIVMKDLKAKVSERDGEKDEAKIQGVVPEVEGTNQMLV